MATAVSAVANGGEVLQPRVVRAVTRDGVRAEVEKKVLRRAISQRTAAQLLPMLEAVVEKGTAKVAPDGRLHRGGQDRHGEEARERQLPGPLRLQRVVCRLRSLALPAFHHRGRGGFPPPRVATTAASWRRRSSSASARPCCGTRECPGPSTRFRLSSWCAGKSAGAGRDARIRRTALQSGSITPAISLGVVPDVARPERPRGAAHDGRGGPHAARPRRRLRGGAGPHGGHAASRRPHRRAVAWPPTACGPGGPRHAMTVGAVLQQALAGLASAGDLEQRGAADGTVPGRRVRLATVAPGQIFVALKGRQRRRRRLRRAGCGRRRVRRGGRGSGRRRVRDSLDCRAERAPGAGASGRGVLRAPEPRSARGGHHGHQRQDHHRVSAWRRSSRRPERAAG